MIEAATMKRIARIRLHQRAERRADVARAEDAVRDAERALETQRLAEERAEAELRAFDGIGPEGLELLARAVVETTRGVASANDAVLARERALAEDRARRTEAERDVRGLELARTRMDQREEQRSAKAEERLLELRAGSARGGRRS